MDVGQLTNPVWRRSDNLRDPAVLPTDEGYRLFYSRFSNREWGREENWAVASVFTRDFVSYEGDRDITPKGFASPDAPVWWQGRYLLAYQSYPTHPARLFFSESADARCWSEPQPFLGQANEVEWNERNRAIDPTLMADGDTLYCFFVGTRQLPAGRHGNLLGLAATADPALKKWRVLSEREPLIGISERAPDGVENVTVFKVGETWVMIYSEGMANQHLAVAESPDLVHWDLRGAIDVPRQSWMVRRYGAPYVWPEADRWIMILMGVDRESRTSFGLLWSEDGRRWIPLPENAHAP